jgi:hypothetical protein
MPTTNCITTGTNIEIFRDFVCPACSTRWRFLAPPSRDRGANEEHEVLTKALYFASEIAKCARDKGEDLENDLVALRSYSNGKGTSSLANFMRNLFSTWEEPGIPPAEMPERIRFLGWVSEVYAHFEPRIQDEISSGALAWERDDKRS